MNKKTVQVLVAMAKENSLLKGIEKRIKIKEKTNDKFWKLKSIERVEYMLHKEQVYNHFRPIFIREFNAIFMLNVILLIIATMFIIAFRSETLIQIVPLIFKISIYYLLIIFLLDVINISNRSKAIKKLMKRFKLF